MNNPGIGLDQNLLCAIDIETTGLRVGYHDIREIAIIPVSRPSFTIKKDISYFNALFAPKYQGEEDRHLTRSQHADMLIHGLAPEAIELMFREWFEKLNLPSGKKLIPLGANYLSFDKPFIQDWLGGPLSYDEFFRSDARDVFLMAGMINDMAQYHSENIVFNSRKLGELARALNYSPEGEHTAIGDCITTIEVYRRMLSARDYAQPISFNAQT